MPVFSVSLPNSLYDWLEKSRGEKKRSAYIADLLDADRASKERTSTPKARRRSR
jgi:metal-responsive CopG/Arc/MetJ family transcriptional regulator